AACGPQESHRRSAGGRIVPGCKRLPVRSFLKSGLAGWWRRTPHHTYAQLSSRGTAVCTLLSASIPVLIDRLCAFEDRPAIEIIAFSRAFGTVSASLHGCKSLHRYTG